MKLSKNIIANAHTSLLLKQSEYMNNPFQKKIMLVTASITFIGLSLLSSSARADGGFAGMIKTGAEQADSAKESIGKIFAAGGFAGVGYGVMNWWKKGKEGEQSRISGAQIFVPMLAGAAMGSIGFMMNASSETVGIDGGY